MKHLTLVIQFVVLFSSFAVGQVKPNDLLSYLKQNSPGFKPKIFAPGIISTKNEYEFGSAFSKKMDKVFYAVRLNKDWKAEIRYIQIKDSEWTKPKRLNLDTAYGYNDPYLSKDGDKLFFVSNRPLDGKGISKDFDIWYQQLINGEWSRPINVGAIINSEKDEFYISETSTGTIYFASNIHHPVENKWDFDIYCSKMENGKYQAPLNLGNSINTEYFECDAFVSPDESYIIFCSSRPGGYGEGDLYISFKTKNGSWTKAKNMGELINTDTHEFCPFVTRDGKYFFYTSRSDIYWVDAKIIEQLKEKELDGEN